MLNVQERSGTFAQVTFEPPLLYVYTNIVKTNMYISGRTTLCQLDPLVHLRYSSKLNVCILLNFQHVQKKLTKPKYVGLI